MSIIVNDVKKIYGSTMEESNKYITKDQYLAKMRKAYPNFNITDRQYELLMGITYLVMNTKITSKNTKNYIRSHESSVKRFVDSYNLTVKESEKLKASSVSQNVDYDRKKLLEFFSDDIITKINSYGWEERIADYEKMLNNARAKYAGNRKMLNNLALDINKTTVNDNLSEQEFDDLLTTIGPYTKTQMKYISENIPINQAGYLNYLVSAHKLEGEDLARFKYLRILLEGEEVGETKKHSDSQSNMVSFQDTDSGEKKSIENESKSGINKEVTVDKYGLKTTRIQYDSYNHEASKEDDSDEEDYSDLEEIDFGDITGMDLD